MKKAVIIGIIVVIVLAVGGFFVMKTRNDSNSKSSNNPLSVPDQDRNDANNPNAAVNQFTETNTVSIQNFSFQPVNIAVKKGTKVTWINNDSMAHTVTANDGSFNSGTLQPGSSFNFTFNKKGTFVYHCNFHSSMTGQVKVE